MFEHSCIVTMNVWRSIDLVGHIKMCSVLHKRIKTKISVKVPSNKQLLLTTLQSYENVNLLPKNNLTIAT